MEQPDAKPAKAQFAPLPIRAIGDGRLSALDLRVLACIAYHDRMSITRGKGQGAWASNDTLAKRVGCHYTNLSTAVTRLGRLGYLEKGKHPLNKNLRVYRVLHDTVDTLSHDKPSPSPDGISADETLCELAKPDAGTVCPPPEITAPNQSDGSLEYISQSDERYSAEAGEKTHLKVRVAEAPRIAIGKEVFRDGEPPNETLAKFERQWKRDWTVFRPAYAEWENWLYGIAEDFAGVDQIASNRAMRLYEGMGAMQELYNFEQQGAGI